MSRTSTARSDYARAGVSVLGVGVDAGDGANGERVTGPGGATVRTLVAGVLVLALAIAGSACSKRSSKTPSTVVADTLGNGVPRVLVSQLGSWVQLWRLAAPRFEPDSLARVATSSFTVEYSRAGAGSYVNDERARAGIKVPSPDSARALDFDSYLGVGRGPDGAIELMREPDSSPELADFARDSVWRVAFCGTPCFYDGGYWLDRDRFALTGATQTGEQGNGPWCAFLEIYDLKTRRLVRWQGPVVDEAQKLRFIAASDSALLERIRRESLVVKR